MNNILLFFDFYIFIIFRCYTPKALYNSRLLEIEDDIFSCKSSKRLSALLPMAVVTLCFLLVVIALWFFVFIPRYQSRRAVIQNVVYPTTPYTILPLNPNSAEVY